MYISKFGINLVPTSRTEPAGDENWEKSASFNYDSNKALNSKCCVCYDAAKDLIKMTNTDEL